MSRVVAASTLSCLLLLARTATGQATFSGSISTVAAYVTVVRDDGAFVSGLSVKDFEVREDGKLRTITQFEPGALPITIAVMIDNSPSMQASAQITRAAAAALVRRLKPGDRAAVGTFGREVRLQGGVTGDREALLEFLQTAAPLASGTAVWDALALGMWAVQREGGRRVVLVLSDGDDNSSNANASDVADGATRDGVMIYAVGVRSTEGRVGKQLKDLSHETGGWFFELKPHADLAATFQRVVDELRSQYLLGFSPAILDGSVHRIDVKVKRQGLTARTRKSYVAAPLGATAVHPE